MKSFHCCLTLVAVLSIRLACVPVPVPAQTVDYVRDILVITGASSEEDLDDQEVERFAVFLSHPLRLNGSSVARLVSSGLLSQYQAASLNDYRTRSGDVRSLSELALVEGFDERYVAALAPFVSLESDAAVGESHQGGRGLLQDALLRGAVKVHAASYGLKYKLSIREKTSLSLAARSNYDDPSWFPPSSWSGNLTINGRSLLSRVVFGDYNMRLGQGLSLWSGMSLGGFSSSSSFSRRPTGLAPTWSWSGIGSHRGVSAEFLAGSLTFTPFISFPGLRERMEGVGKGDVSLMPGTSVYWSGRNGRIGMSAWRTGERGKVSVDFRWNIYGIDLFGEVADDLTSGAVAAVAGSSYSIGEGWRVSGVARWYPSSFDAAWCGGVRSWTKTSDERGVAVGLERYGFQLTADLGVKDSDRTRRQVKLYAKVPVQISPNSVLSVRVTGRYRPYEDYLVYRTGFRTDVDWSSGGISARYGESDRDAWKGRLRVESILCKSLSGLAYMEIGRKTSSLTAYLRGTVFIVDNWDDRIYSYERDAPGNFSVPAYYGRGLAISFYGGRKFSIWNKKTLKVYLRVSDISYALMETPKPSVREARLQAVLAI
ncbi:MAG: general secretion pathway protein GspK [Bacteroidales bacterium]|nr:general secretion pathway protein GspK [Bacteroidales bacterium]